MSDNQFNPPLDRSADQYERDLHDTRETPEPDEDEISPITLILIGMNTIKMR